MYNLLYDALSGALLVRVLAGLPALPAQILQQIPSYRVGGCSVCEEMTLWAAFATERACI
jgi:hypothetical protein